VTPLSVLDLAVVPTGGTSGQALRDSVALAQRVERLGYRRFWVAEHHGMPGVASASPPVLLAAVAGATETIRVGSGGVMLPNHAPLVVAEQFGTLEALHPGRIDLGLGRAPGTDPVTARALRRHGNLAADDFPESLMELLGYFAGAQPEGHPFEAVTAVPGAGYRPSVWLLGSSDFSAIAAGMLGLPFSFAHHFSAGNTDTAVAAYRANFRPSPDLDEPYLMLGVSVICAEDDQRADWLAGPSRLSFVRLRTGRPQAFATPEEAAERTFTPMEKELLKGWEANAIVGSPSTVEAKLRALVDRTGADELIVTTMVHGHQDRVRSYELLADLAGLTAQAA